MASLGVLPDVAVFPLPRVVLFPGTRLPLHIFEPRYRAMMADCLEQRRLELVIAQLRPGWQQDYAGQPPLFEVATVGHITEHSRNADGTYDIALLGVARVQLQELPLGDKPYRRATATPLIERQPAQGIARSELTTLYSQAVQLTALVQERQPRFRLLASPDDAASAFIDKLADQFIGDPALRQRVLERVDLAERLQLVAAQIAQLQLTFLAPCEPDELQ